MKWMLPIALLLLPVFALSAAEKKAAPSKAATSSRNEPIPIEPPESQSSSGRREPNSRVPVIQFQGDDISLVLRTLAREAGMNVAISPEVKGLITLRVEDKNPSDVFKIIVQANGYMIKEIEGVPYVCHPDEPLKQEAKRIAHEARLLFDELLAEKFTREEAMKLVIELRRAEKTEVEKPARNKK